MRTWENSAPPIGGQAFQGWAVVWALDKLSQLELAARAVKSGTQSVTEWQLQKLVSISRLPPRTRERLHAKCNAILSNLTDASQNDYERALIEICCIADHVLSKNVERRTNWTQNAKVNRREEYSEEDRNEWRTLADERPSYSASRIQELWIKRQQDKGRNLNSLGSTIRKDVSKYRQEQKDHQMAVIPTSLRLSYTTNEPDY